MNFSDPLEPNQHYVPLRRPCDDPHAVFQRIRTVQPGQKPNPAPPVKLQQARTEPGTVERLALVTARLKAKGVLI